MISVVIFGGSESTTVNQYSLPHQHCPNEIQRICSNATRTDTALSME